MIFDRIMLPAQGRNEDYKFAQTGSVTLVRGVDGAGGTAPTPSWLENVIKLDPESGFLSVDDWHVKGTLVIEGQVNQWLAQQLVVDDARIQVNRKQDGAVVDSGLVIFDKDTSSEVSSLVYDVDGVWKAGGDRLFTDAYNPKLGGYAASNYPRKAENAVITGKWTFNDFLNGNLGIGITPTERLHVAGNGLFTGGLTAGGNVSAPTFVSGFAGSGWRLEAGTENHFTIDRLTVRGRMDVYELAVNQIRGTNGALWVSDSAKVASVSGNRLTIDTGGDTSFVPFAVNDLLRCQRWNGKNIKYYVVRVTAVGNNYIDVVLVDGSSPREAGDHLVRMGNTVDTNRQGALYLTSSDSNAPYMDVLDGVNSASFAGKTKVRIGRLDGITDPDLGTLSGYGLYTENGYFKGKIQVTGGNAATKADVDAVQVGGRNLFFKSGFSSGTSGNDVTGWGRYEVTSLQVEEDKPFLAPGVNTISWIIVSGAYDGGYYQRFRSPNGTSITDYFKAGEQYTVSAWIKSSSPATMNISARGIVTESVAVTTEWKKYSLTFTGDGTNHTISFYGRTQGVRYYLCMPKLELGNRATDWTPAPEDVPSALDYLATAIQDGSTDIEGGLINTNVLMVKDTNGAVRGGISGLKEDNIGFWTGGTYQDAINNNANVIFRKDGSFLLAGGKISGTEEGDVTIDGNLITGVIESQNWDGENGSRLNLMDGSLEFGNTIKVDSLSKEIIVKDGDTQNTGVRIGDFLLSPTTGGAGALDVDLSGSRTIPAQHAYTFGLRDDLMTYINGSGVIGSSSVTVSTNLTAGNNYTFQTSINVRITRGVVINTTTDPIGAPSTIINSISRGDVWPRITVSLFSGATKVGERSFSIIEKSDLGVATFSDQTLNINIPFTAASNNLRVEITQSGEVVWKVRYPTSQGSLVEFRNAGLIYSELDASSRVRIIPSAAINELSAKGFLSLWGPEKYFRIYDRAGVTNFIEARGVQMFISPNGVHRLRITDEGIQKSSNSGVSWTTL